MFDSIIYCLGISSLFLLGISVYAHTKFDKKVEQITWTLFWFIIYIVSCMIWFKLGRIDYQAYPNRNI
jgi:hypothetical protein